MKTKFDMNKVTVVSALFNINRTDGRKWEEYLKWFDIFLKLKVPMVLFVTEDVKAFIDERRTDSPTEVIVQSIEDIPYQYLQDDIQKILDSDEYKENISDPDRIECQQAMYSVIQYSKFPWMKKHLNLILMILMYFSGWMQEHLDFLITLILMNNGLVRML